MAEPKKTSRSAPNKTANTQKKPVSRKTKSSYVVEPSKQAKDGAGRPTTYTPEIAAEICAHIIDNKRLREIAQMEGMPAVSTIMLWLAKHEEFSEQYAIAKREQAELYTDEIISISDETSVIVKEKDGFTEVVLDSTAVARNRLRIDARKWVASKLLPKKYGDKVDVNHGGQIENPLQLLVQQVSGSSLVAIEDDED